MKHSIYKIETGNQKYYGYTSRPPKERYKEHLNSAKEGNNKLYKALKKNKMKHSFEIVGSYDNEVDALVKEIALIHEDNTTEVGLNTSTGGEGKTMTVNKIEKNGKVHLSIIPKEI